MTDPVQIIFPPAPLGVQNAIDTVAQLRALDSTQVDVNTEVLVAATGFYKFDPSSLAADDGTTVLKPDDLTTLQAGRWLIVPIATGNSIVVTPGISLQTKLNALDATDTANAANIATNTANIATNTLDISLAQTGRSSEDPVFDDLLNLVTIIDANQGEGAISQDADVLFQSQYTVSATKKYVAPWGNDANDGTSPAKAVLTLTHARTLTAGTIEVLAGFDEEFPAAPGDWRYTDAGGASARRFVAPAGCVVGTSGTDLAAATWAANGTYPNVWETAASDLPTLGRLLRTDIRDEEGRPTPIPMAASLVALGDDTLSTAGHGWLHDKTANKFYLRIGDTDIEADFKPNLIGVYQSATNNQTLLYSATAYWENFTFQGQVFVLFVPGQAQPVGYFKNCKWEYTLGHGLLNEGGLTLTQNCTTYRTGGDGANYNLGTANAPASYVENGFTGIFPGDEASFPGQTLNPATAPTPGAYNNQISSSHNAPGVRVNTGGYGMAGEGIADTQSGGIGAQSLIVTPQIGRSLAPIGNLRTSLYFQDCEAWVDNATALDGTVSDNATVHVYLLRGPRTTLNGGTFVNYTPTP